MLRFHEKKFVAQFMTRKMRRKMTWSRMNENFENWQCGVLIALYMQEPLKQMGPLPMGSHWGLGRTNQILWFFTIPPFIAHILSYSLLNQKKLCLQPPCFHKEMAHLSIWPGWTLESTARDPILPNHFLNTFSTMKTA